MPHSDHDQLFRDTFEHPRHALGLVRQWVPAAIAEQIDWATLKLESGAFVDGVSSKYADLLFSVRFRDGRPLLLQLLIEHQSTSPARAALKIAGYVVRALERYADEHAGSQLPAILPLVVSQCERPWSAACQLRELYELDPPTEHALGDYLLDVRYLVDDLMRQTEEQIRRRTLTVQAAVTLLALRGVRYSRVFTESFRRWADLMAQMTVDELGPVLVYALRVGEEPTEALRDVLSSTVNSEAGDLVMTTAERLIAEGMEKERRHMLVTLLEARFPGEVIPPTVRRRIAEAPADMLMQWFQQAARASSLQDAFAEAEND